MTLALKRRSVAPLPPLEGEGPSWLGELVHSLTLTGTEVTASLPRGASRKEIARYRWLVQADRDAAGAPLYRVYDLGTRVPGRHHGQIAGTLVAEGRLVDEGSESAHAALRAVSKLSPGNLALLPDEMSSTPDFVLPFVPWPQATWVDVPVRLLSNGSETHAVVVPVDGSGAAVAPLGMGTYRLDFRVDRARFRAQTPDAVSNYGAEASVVVSW